MRPKVHELEAIIRKKVCTVCETRTVEGSCGLKSDQGCSLFQLFPYVAQAILATDSDTIDAYVQAIRENVCSVCIDQRLDGTCPKREDASCALDQHLPAIIEAIEEAKGRVLERPLA